MGYISVLSDSGRILTRGTAATKSLTQSPHEGCLAACDGTRTRVLRSIPLSIRAQASQPGLPWSRRFKLFFRVHTNVVYTGTYVPSYHQAESNLH